MLAMSQAKGSSPSAMPMLRNRCQLAVEIAVYLAILYFSSTFVMKAVDTGRTMQIGTDTWLLWPIAVMMPLAFLLMLLEMLRLFWVDAVAIFRG